MQKKDTIKSSKNNKQKKQQGSIVKKQNQQIKAKKSNITPQPKASVATVTKRIKKQKSEIQIKNTKKQKSDYKKLIIEGHRGFIKDSIENTLQSFQNAIDCGLDSIELDAWLTKDNKVIINHGDLDGQCYFTYKKKKYHVKDLTADQVQSIQLSKKYPNQRTPLLSEVFELCRDKIRVNVELKGGWQQPKLAEEVLKLIFQAKMEKQVIISSFDHTYYDSFKKYLAKQKEKIHIPFSFLFCYVKSKQNQDESLFKYDCVDFNKVEVEGNQVCFPNRLLDNVDALKKIREARERGFFMNCYFPMIYKENFIVYDKLINEGVQGFITNDPLLAFKFRGKK